MPLPTPSRLALLACLLLLTSLALGAAMLCGSTGCLRPSSPPDTVALLLSCGYRVR